MGGDAFVSYTSADRKWAEWVAWVLEEAGWQVIVQDWDFVPGTTWVRKMEDAVLRSTRTLALCSPAYLASSDYGRMEWQTALRADPTGEERRLVPVKIRDCELSGLLGNLTWIDLTGHDEAGAQEFLLAGFAAMESGRAKPPGRPEYPGGRVRVQNRPEFPGQLPPVFNVRRPNPRFTGRNDLLSGLHEALRSAGRVTVASVRGLGGVGKTETAVEYCHRSTEEYDTVWWVDAEDPETIPTQLAELGVVLGLATDHGDAVATAAKVRAALGHRDRWLLIFDNAEDPAGIEQWIPAAGRGAVLVTTRRAGYESLGPVLEVPVWDRPESLAFLVSRRPGITNADANRLAETLGDLPLALEQATAYLDTAQLTPARYLELWEKAGARLLARGHATGHAHTVATVWTLAMDRIAAKSPAADLLLRVCALLAPEPIPTSLFTETPDSWPPALREAVSDDLEFDDTVAVLLSYALVTRDGDTIRMHRLVQTVTTAHTPKPQHETLLAATSTALCAICRFDVQMPDAWTWWREYLPHVLVAARAGLALPTPAEPSGSTDASAVLHAAGRYVGEIGQVQQAIELLEIAFDSDQHILGPDHPHTLTTRHELARWRGEAGDPAETADAFAALLKDLLRVLGPDHPDTLSARHNLAYWRGESGDFVGAVEGLVVLLEDRLRVLGPDHLNTLTTRHNLAHWRGQSGDFVGAVEGLVVLLEDRLRVLGPDHPHTLNTRHYLAHWRGESGDIAGAVEALAALLKDCLRVLGSDHPNTLNTRNSLDYWRDRTTS